MQNDTGRNDRLAIQYTADPALLGGIEDLLSHNGGHSVRARDGRSVYAVLPQRSAQSMRQDVRALTLRHPGQSIHIRWTNESYLDDTPDEVWVRDGALVYAPAPEVAVTWSGALPEPEARKAITAALAEQYAKLAGLPSMENLTLTLRAGDAQARVESAGGGREPHARVSGLPKGMRNEHILRLLSVRA